MLHSSFHMPVIEPEYSQAKYAQEVFAMTQRVKFLSLDQRLPTILIYSPIREYITKVAQNYMR